MTKKECMMIRTSFVSFLDELSYEEIGKIFTLMFLYSTPEEQRTDEQQETYQELMNDRLVRFAFSPFKKALDDDNKKYESVVARNKMNGKKGGRPRKTQSVLENPENPVGFSETQKSPTITTTPTTTSFISSTMVDKAPSLEEVLDYAKWICVTNEEAERFFWYYEKLGWLINDRPIKNWRAALSSWKNNSYRFNNDTNNNTSSEFHTNRREELANIALQAAKKSAGEAK